jgi:hypothetical protein
MIATPHEAHDARRHVLMRTFGPGTVQGAEVLRIAARSRDRRSVDRHATAGSVRSTSRQSSRVFSVHVDAGVSPLHTAAAPSCVAPVPSVPSNRTSPPAPSRTSSCSARFPGALRSRLRSQTPFLVEKRPAHSKRRAQLARMRRVRRSSCARASTPRCVAAGVTENRSNIDGDRPRCRRGVEPSSGNRRARSHAARSRSDRFVQQQAHDRRAAIPDLDRRSKSTAALTASALKRPPVPWPTARRGAR